MLDSPATEGATMSKRTERFLLIAVTILLIERILFYATTLPAFLM